MTIEFLRALRISYRLFPESRATITIRRKPWWVAFLPPSRPWRREWMTHAS